MSLYQSKEIIPIFTQTGIEMKGKGGYEVGTGTKGARVDIGPTRSSESWKTVQHRIIGLAQKGIVIPDRVDGRGFGSTRLFSKQKVLEIAVAFELMRYGVLTEHIGYILARVRKQGSKVPKYLVYLETDSGIEIKTPSNLRDMDRFFDQAQAYSPYTMKHSALVINISGLKERIEMVLGK